MMGVEAERPYAALTERFRVHNVFPSYQEAWSGPAARAAWTDHLLRELQPDGEARLVLVALGRRVAYAVGCPQLAYFRWLEAGLLEVVCIPHPSGLNRLYNDPAVCLAAGATLLSAIERAR